MAGFLRALRSKLMPFVLIVVAALCGYGLHAWLSPPQVVGIRVSAGEGPAAEAEAQRWTCSMHPNVNLPGPGQCPICSMPLIPVQSESDSGGGGMRRLTTSAAGMALMDIQTSPVERRFVAAEVRMVGKVAYDETGVAYITAWVPGRLDRLFVDYTGVQVSKGDHMVYIYSPQLISAQEELLQALKAVRELSGSNVSIIKETARATVAAARDRLRLWGLQPEQIQEIEEQGTPTDHITIYAPIGGTVIHKHAQEGMYVQTGTRIYTISDLSRVWVLMDAYESDLEWLRYGQEVTFTTDAYPSDTFVGRIAFIDPVVSPKTRTVKVRVNVPNPQFKLKPEMFVRGIVRAQVAMGGRVMEPELAGKYICPMHPEIVKVDFGACDVCGMDLVTTESLGYLPVAAEERAKPLVIPASAALVTGTRAVVYVLVPDADKPTFDGREVVLGPRAGAYYIVRHGLEEGELVVTRGNFKIDSALQIEAKPSMMSPEGGGGGAGHHHGGEMPVAAVAAAPPRAEVSPAPAAETPTAFRKQLGSVWKAYQKVHAALAGDDGEGARHAAGETADALAAVDMAALDPEGHMAWMPIQGDLEGALRDLRAAGNLDDARPVFERLSVALSEALQRFGAEPAGPVYKLRCPMAFGGKGAIWLQEDRETRNPYYGAAMLKCGDVAETILPEPAPAGSAHAHE